MDATTVALVQDSWRQALPIADVAGKLFYANLFLADPALERMFSGDIAHQAGKLMQMIDVAVGKLGEPDVLLPVLERLGARHLDYGVRPEHYATVGGALLKTLEQGLGPAFTPDVRAAWAAVYGQMAEVMTKAPARVPG